MKFRRNEDFIRDFAELSAKDQESVRIAFPEVVSALNGNTEMYRKYRIKKMEKDKSVYEGHIKINLVFTLKFECYLGQDECVFRRIGTHKIYKNP